MKFVALDFETANHDPGSACALAMVVVEGGTITTVRHRLIRPPTPDFVFTYLHGINWAQVSTRLGFGPVWDELLPLTAGATYLVAHNAPFDRRVLHSCCGASKRAVPRLPFVCTVRLAREAWGIYPTKLPDVCKRLGIRLKHHDAESDAVACATIAATAIREGHALDGAVVRA